jgi:hypothetical protein
MLKHADNATQPLHRFCNHRLGMKTILQIAVKARCDENTMRLGISAVPCYTMLRGIPGFPNLALRSRPRAAHERWARATESAGVLSAQCRRRVRAPKRRPDGNVRTGACDYQSRYSDYPYPSPDYRYPYPDYPYPSPDYPYPYPD